MKRKHGFALPFVVTAAALATSCGGNTDANGGSGGTGTAGTSATGGSGGGGTGGGTGGGHPLCPPSLPSAYDACSVPTGDTCPYTVACQSGDVTIELTCGAYGWNVVPKACDKPYDSCPGTELYCQSEWMMPQGTNPPAPCPATKPAEGASCYAGGFGGVWPDCGYPCDPVTKSGWTIASCTLPDAGSDGAWRLDDACPNQ